MIVGAGCAVSNDGTAQAAGTVDCQVEAIITGGACVICLVASGAISYSISASRTGYIVYEKIVRYTLCALLEWGDSTCLAELTEGNVGVAKLAGSILS